MKPAMARGNRKSIAAELLASVLPPPYKLHVAALNEKDALPVGEFKNSRWADYYTADTSNIVRNGRGNPNHVFELFGKYDGKNACEVRMALLNHIASNMEFYERRAVMFLHGKGISFPTWIESIGNETMYCDELALLGLCVVYSRHCLVITRDKFWSTLETINPIGMMDLLKQCNIKLLFLGQLRFGVLNWNPRPPKAKPRELVPKFSIVEEYTIDEPPPVEMRDTVVSSIANMQKMPVTSNDTGFPVETTLAANAVVSSNFDVQKIADPDLPVNITPTAEQPRPTDNCKNNPDKETIRIEDALAQAEPPHMSENSGSCLANVGTHVPKNINVEVKPACADDGVIIDQYLWKEKAVVKVKRLSDISVDIWCNNVSNYYEYQPTPDPLSEPTNVKLTLVKGYGGTKRSITDENEVIDVKRERVTSPVETDDIGSLLSQAEKLVNKAKELATVTDNTAKRNKSKPKRKGKSLAVKQDVSRVGTTTDALNALHQKTMVNLTPIGTDPRKTVRVRTIYCKLCTECFSSVGELNRHHRNDHGVVSCKDCDKKFSSQTSLEKHAYTHGDLKYVCELCGKRFPFVSRLEQHSKVHINQKIPCPIKSCKRVFKGVGDVNRHVKTHKKGGWFKCNYCDYRNKDKRNTNSHMRTHQSVKDSRYECDKCHKRMRFSTQYIRHRKTCCTVSKGP